MLKYVESPGKWEFDPSYPRVFLAGGITGCANWQSELHDKLLKSGESMVVFNPRRENFPINDPSAGPAQVAWEFYHFRMSSCIIFWFSSETVQPIVMFELGAWSMFNVMDPGRFEIVVGTHPSYPRKQDVELQMHFLSPEMKIHDSLDAVADSVVEHARSYHLNIEAYGHKLYERRMWYLSK